jgi:hypothetical protein
LTRTRTICWNVSSLHGLVGSWRWRCFER